MGPFLQFGLFTAPQFPILNQRNQLMNKLTLTLKKLLPILEWLPRYRKSDLPGDLSAGLTVGIMLIPQGMAYAMLAGLAPVHGLYAVTVPLLLYAVFGTSRQLAVGPDAIISILTAAGIAAITATNSPDYLLHVLTLTLMVGGIRFLMGLFRLGFVVNFLSRPVVNGFTSAAAITIGLSQFKYLLHIDLPQTGHLQDMLYALVRNAGQIHWLTFGFGLLGVLIIVGGKLVHRLFPSSLLAVVVGTVAVSALALNEQGIQIVGAVPAGFPEVSVPSFDLALWRRLLPLAVTIALVGYAQSFAIAKSLQAKRKDPVVDANQELVALGLANLGAAFFSGFPVAGGFSRTAVNDKAGANTALSSMISATLILITLAFFTELFFSLPLAILAAIILVAIFSLIDVTEPLALWKKDRSDFAMWLATFGATLMLGIEIGILSGMGLSLLMVVYKASRPHMAEVGRVPGTSIYRNIKRFENLETWDDLLMVRLDGPLYFANVDYVKRHLDQWLNQRRGKVKALVLNMESVTSLDSTGANALADWISEWRRQEIDLYITAAKGPIRDVLMQWELIDKIGVEYVFMDDQTAVEFFSNRLDKDRLSRHRAYSTQSNIRKD